jgi:hypothetical protein
LVEEEIIDADVALAYMAESLIEIAKLAKRKQDTDTLLAVASAWLELHDRLVGDDEPSEQEHQENPGVGFTERK